jgi:hypothetical protein
LVRGVGAGYRQEWIPFSPSTTVILSDGTVYTISSETKGFYVWVLDYGLLPSFTYTRLQGILDIAALVPGLNTPAGLVSAGISLRQGNYGEAGFSALTALPIVGTFAKYGRTGANAAKNFFEGTRYSDRVLEKMKLGDFHSFPELVTNYAEWGNVRKLVGKDGITREKLEIPGQYMGKDGAFEFIKEADGLLTHRFFNPRGK